MKKTLTINLGGAVFHIDEDAYRLLDNYLANLRIHFRREEGAEEIVRDMEQRISELFAERLHEGRQVITIEDVEAIITQMGQPEELFGEEAPKTERHSYARTSKRLYRDPDDKILGGVAAGFAAYLDWDVTWIRLGLALLSCVVHGLILAYIILWIVVPLARTAPEKLAMKGKTINLENIGKTVTDGFERVNSYVRSDRPRSFLHSLGEGLVAVAGFLIKFLMVLVAICFAPVLLALLVVFIALILVATGLIASVPAVLCSAIPAIDWSLAGASPLSTILMSICGILAIGIPIIGLIHLIMRHFGGWEPMSTVTRVIFILLWLIALGIDIFFLLNSSFIASHINF